MNELINECCRMSVAFFAGITVAVWAMWFVNDGGDCPWCGKVGGQR